MGVELCSNVLQTIVAVATAITAVTWAHIGRKKEYVFVAGFFCALALGIGYWLTYQLLNMETPQIFYVADLTWIAAFLFLICLEMQITPPQVKKYYHPLMCIPIVVAVPLTVYFCTWGAVLVNILSVGSLAYVAYLALGNLLYHRARGIASPYQGIHRVCLVYVFTEYALWLSSCFWVSDTMTNPYFWFDFAITAELVWLLVATKKAVAV